MKVLQINKFFYRRGGAETHFLDLCHLLESKGHEVIHFSTQNPANELSPYSRYFVKGIEMRGRHGLFSGLKIAEHIFYSSEAARQLECLIKKTKPEIAHLHNIYRHLSPSILLVLKKYKIPMVMTLHDYKLICPNYQLFTQGKICERCKRHKYYQAIFHRCVFGKILPSAAAALEMSFHKLWGVYEKNINIFISPSQFLKDKFIEWGQAGKKIKVLPNFVIPSDGSPKNSHPELVSGSYEMPKQVRHDIKKYLLYFGRLSQEKGLLTLLSAMQKLPEVSLHIVGDGPLFLPLKKGEIKRGFNITLVGYKSGFELAQEIAGAQAIVVPSVWYENYPLSVLEAMSYGKPVIASAIGGLLEIVREGESGFLFRPGDVNDLADKLKQLWADENLAKKMGQTAQAQVLKENSFEKYYQELMAVYESL